MRDQNDAVQRLTAALAGPRELFQAGRGAEAERMLRSLLDSHREPDDTELAAEVYCARVSHALMLTSLGRRREAVETLRRMVAAQGPVGREASMDRAWFYAHKRLIEIDEGVPDPLENHHRTVAAIDTVVRRFGPLTDPEIDRGLAELLHLAANAWLNVGAEQRAVEVLLGDIAERWADTTDEHVAWWVRMAQVRAALLVRLRPPIGFIDPENGEASSEHLVFPWLAEERRHVRRNAERQLACAPSRKQIKAVRRELECNLRHLDELLDDAIKAHNEAVAIIDAYRHAAEPFALYLRNFEADMAYALLPSDDPDELPNTYFAVNSFPCELVDRPVTDGAIIRGLQEHVTTLTATNTYGGSLDQPLSVPRLMMPGTTWRETVSVLVAAAEFVVLRIVLLTPGVRDELDLIRRRAREANTVVLLARPADQESRLDFFAYQKAAYRLDKADPEIIPIDSPLLAGLRVVYDDDFYDPHTQVGVFDEHIPAIRQLAAMHPLDRFDHVSGRLAPPAAG